MVCFPKLWSSFAGLEDSDLPCVPEPAYPPSDLRYRALEMLSPEAVRVVILGQDPYHGAGQANGLAFSVPQGCQMPPSLRNIFAELASDTGRPLRVNTDLSDWANQGVLLLNTALSVAPDQPDSHAGLGWSRVTDALIRALGAAGEIRRVFVLWGKHAQAKSSLIADEHFVLSSAHPSPLSAYRGFLGSRPFSRANQWLTAQGDTPIKW